jgi:hypothetical protein
MTLQSALRPRLQITNSNTTGAFVPKLMRVQLRFQHASTVPTDGKVSNLYYSGNSVYNPGTSFTSAKPPGFALLAQLYNRYRVLGSRCHVLAEADTKTANTSGSLFQVEMVLLPATQSPSFTGTSVAGAQLGAKTIMFNIIKPSSLVSTISTSKILGAKDVEGPDRLQALVSANPAKEWFWIVSIASTTDMSTLNVARITTTLTYDVEFFERAANLGYTLTDLWEAAFQRRCKELSESKTLRQTLDDNVESEDSELVPVPVHTPSLKSAESKKQETPPGSLSKDTVPSLQIRVAR